MSDLKKFIGIQIKKLRKTHEMNQEEFANSLNSEISRGHISRIESGSNMPSAEIIKNICDTFNISPEWILYGTGKGPEKDKLLSNEEKEKFIEHLKYQIAIGKKIKEIRENQKLSREDFSVFLDLDPNDLEEYESGRKPFTSYMLYKIYKRTGIMPAFVLDPDEVVTHEYHVIDKGYSKVAEDTSNYNSSDLDSFDEYLSRTKNLTGIEKNTFYFFRKLPKDEQEEVSRLVMWKYEKVSKKGMLSTSDSGEDDEEAAAKELA